MADRRPMGLGVVGRNDIVFKHAFRYTLQIQGFCNNQANRIPEHFVQVAARPSISTEEVQIDFLNGRTWIPGKSSWEAISVTYLDAANEEMRSLYNWLATVYNFTDPVNLNQGSKRDWAATGVLNMYDGCGHLLEGWELQNVWPTSVNFGTLDYGDSKIATIELNLRYSDVRYRSYCPDFVPESCCTPCGSF